MKVEEIGSVGIIGAGTMGAEIGFVCALAGYDTLLHDLEQSRLDAALARLEPITRQYVESGTVSEEARRLALARIDGTTDAGRVAQCDLLSESVFEELDVKREVWARLGESAPPHTIFTTNTSSIAPSMFAAATGRPEQFAAMHFHLPILGNRVVDVMTHGATSKQTMDLVTAFVERLGLVPLRLEKESAAYVYNAMLIAFLTEGVRLLVDGIASKEQIDGAWTNIMHTGAGPLVIIDYVGVDTVWRIMKGLAADGDHMAANRVVDYLGEMVQRGELGMKSGKGFYDYPETLGDQHGRT